MAEASELSEFLARASADDLALAKFTFETHAQVAERFLGARSGDADKALRLLSECAQAKTKYRVPYLKTLTPEEILGVDEHVFTHFYPHGQRGHDRLHRPIVFEDSGGINIGAVLHMTTLERLRDLHLYSMEVSVDRLLSQYHSSFGNASGTADSTESAAKIVAVSDLSRVTLSHVSARLLEHLKGLAQIDNMCYPEVLGNMFLVNAPHIAVVAYKVIKAFIDKKTQRKIEALGPGQSATRLLQVIDAAELPRSLGGSGEEPYSIRPHTGFVSIAARCRFTYALSVPAGSSLTVDSYIRDSPMHLSVVDARDETELFATTFMAKSHGAPTRRTVEVACSCNGTRDVLVRWSHSETWSSRSLVYALTLGAEGTEETKDALVQP